MARAKTTLCPATPFRLQERDERRAGKKVIEDPAWRDIEAAIRRLDNDRYTDVSLTFGEGQDETSMAISGGHEDRVVCYVARPEDPDWEQEFRYVVDRGWRRGTFGQVIGGQASDLPARLSVRRELALQAARHFVEHRALDPDLRWEIL